MSAVIKIRRAVREDMHDVLDLIQELADFVKCPQGPQLTAADLIRDGGFDSDTARPLFVCFVAEVENSDCRTRRVIGYALSYFKSYNNPGSRVLHLEDLYVREPHRSNGVDIKLLETVELFARESGCSWLLHQIMRWNPDVSLYKQIGAVDITATDGWHQFRVTGQTLVELAK